MRTLRPPLRLPFHYIEIENALVRPDPPSARRQLFGLACLAVRVQRLADNGDRLVRAETVHVDSEGLDQVVEPGCLPRSVDENGHAERSLDDEGGVARMEA